MSIKHFSTGVLLPLTEALLPFLHSNAFGAVIVSFEICTVELQTLTVFSSRHWKGVPLPNSLTSQDWQEKDVVLELQQIGHTTIFAPRVNYPDQMQDTYMPPPSNTKAAQSNECLPLPFSLTKGLRAHHKFYIYVDNKTAVNSSALPAAPARFPPSVSLYAAAAHIFPLSQAPPNSPKSLVCA